MYKCLHSKGVFTIEDNKVSSEIKEGIKAGLPLVVGYMPIAMSFGILAKTGGLSMLDSFFFSAIVFAGASQFMALNLLVAGVGTGEIILTTLLVNFRHFLMSASLATKITKDMKKWIPLIAFGVTDESFSVASFREGQLTKHYMITLQLVSYSAWVIGTVLGYGVGELLPADITGSMGIALYAMFIAILLPEAKKSKKVLMLAILSGFLNTVFSYIQFLPKGWTMILAIVLSAGIGTMVSNKKEVNVCE